MSSSSDLARQAEASAAALSAPAADPGPARDGFSFARYRELSLIPVLLEILRARRGAPS